MRLCAWGEHSLAKNGVSFPKVEIGRGEGGRLVDGGGGSGDRVTTGGNGSGDGAGEVKEE
jgi:hypothetical protein